MSFYYTITPPCPKCDECPMLRRLGNGVAYICRGCNLSSGERFSEFIAECEWIKSILSTLRDDVKNHY